MSLDSAKSARSARTPFTESSILRTLAAILLCFLLIYLVHTWTPGGLELVGWKPDGNIKQPTLWEDLVQGKRDDDLAKIRSEWLLELSFIEKASLLPSIAGEFIESLLDPETLSITSLDVPDLLALTTVGSLSSEAVVTAFCKRAAFAHQLNKSLLEINFESAIEQAKELDAYFKREGKALGPLHGLPVTLKDQYHVKGMNTTMGYVGWIDTFEGSKDSPIKGITESEIVRELESLGAIIIGKTTCVQSLWYGETNNNILGYNFNPVNQNLSSGGSSGGEGAIQALGGSAIGVGADVGGSVSMPASYNGIYSIKPSANRLSFKNVANSSKGQVHIPTVPGIFGRSISSIRLLFEALLSTDPWLRDPEVIPLSWREDQAHNYTKRKLSFGIYAHDGIVRPHPPIERALNMVIDAVQAQGHGDKIVNADGNYDVPQQLALSREPFIPELIPYFPNGKPQKPLNAIEVEHFVQRLHAFRNDYNEYWLSTKDLSGTDRPVDALIMPITPTAAVIPGRSFYYTYTSIINTLDYVAIVIPVTFADRAIDKLDVDYLPVGEVDKRNWNAYDADMYHGAPACVQIVGQRLQEEKLLVIAQRVVDAIEEYRYRQERPSGKDAGLKVQNTDTDDRKRAVRGRRR